VSCLCCLVCLLDAAGQQYRPLLTAADFSVLLRVHMNFHTCAGCNCGSQRGQTHQHRPNVAEQLLCAQEQQIAAHCTSHSAKLQNSI
jgi:hypothetical protein